MSRSDAGGFRADIEGLRGLAVALVLCGHIGLPLVSGGFIGVDVFFVISGFLITGLLVGELRQTGRISFTGFYLRRARRLLPAAGVVLLASLVLTWAFLPSIRWSAVGRDALASSLYAMNWRLADQSADYLRADQAPSILQHFWSLAVEEQFYLLWPLLLAIAVGAAARRGRPLGVRLLFVLAAVAGPSLAWSVHLSQTDPARAYFVTTTRMWELALGGGLAILGRHLTRLPTAVAAVTGWAGIATIAASAVLIHPDTAVFPGYLALAPTLATAAVIIAGASRGGARFGPASVLGLRPVRGLGAISYPLYLWHWPLLIAAQARFGPLSVPAGLVVVAGSVLAAALTWRYVENPVRRGALLVGRTVRIGLAATSVPVLAGLALQLAVVTATPVADGPVRHDPPGAAVLGEHPRDNPAGAPVDRVEAITPDPLAARDDIADVYRDGCIDEASDSGLHPCVYGDAESKMEVALAGDSHAAHWLPALQIIAAQRGWRLVTYIKTSCPFMKAPAIVFGQANDSCTAWNSNLAAALVGTRRPRLLIVSSVTQVPLVNGTPPAAGAETTDAQVAALAQTWSEIASVGLPVVVIRDTPAFAVDVAECVSQHRDALTLCTRPRDAAVAGGQPQERAAQGLAGVHLVNLNDAICPTDPCAAVIGGALVYRDSHHLTATYARTLAPRLQDALRQAVATQLP